MTSKKLKPPATKGRAHLKEPDTQAKGSTQQEYPVFCLRYLGNFDDCEQRSQAAFARRLYLLGKMTWQEITNARKQGLGSEQIPVAQLKIPVPPAFAEEYYVLAFRFDGKAPMLAVRDEATLRIFHLDHNFKAYDHG